MEQNNEPEALDVANQLEKGFITLGKTARALRYEAAEAIRHLHARVQELEAELESIGAGGVSAQRVTQESDHIAQARKTVAAPVCETDAQEPVAWRYQTSTGWHATTDASAALRVSKHHAIEPMYTAPQPQAALPVQAVEKSATHGMNLHQRILHVGGRENAQTYIEFGSVAAVRALVDQVLRDLPDGAQGFAMPAPQPQADARAAERLDALYKALEVCSAELFAQCAHQGRAMKYVEQARKALAAEQCARATIAASKEQAK